MIRIVILGGTYAAWMTAASLSRLLPATHAPSLAVISGVTPPSQVICAAPSLRAFNANLGLSEAELARTCAAWPSLGWRHEGFAPLPFYRVFGEHGVPLNTAAFHHALGWLKAQGHIPAYDDYALAAQMAERGRFAPPSNDPASVTSSYSFGLNLDSDGYAQTLRKIALYSGVKELSGRVSVIAHTIDNHVAAITLDTGQRVEADFFIDTVGDLLRLKGISFLSAGLPIDRILTAPASAQSASANRLKAQTRGYTVQASVNGKDEVRHLWSSAEDPDATGNALVQGRFERFWDGNVLAIGEAAGVIEPLGLETGDFVQRGLARLTALFPAGPHEPCLAEEYNRLMTAEFDHRIDFVRMFHHLWAPVETAPISEPIRNRIEQFRSRGRVVMYDEDTLTEGDFVSVLLGLGGIPDRYERRLDVLDGVHLHDTLSRMRRLVAETAHLAPTLSPQRAPHA